MKLAIQLWRALGSIQLTIALTFLLAIDLGVGYLSLRRNLEIFTPISNVGLLEWLDTYGVANPQHAFWFFAMLALLGGLAINTFVCTTERALHILRQSYSWRELPFRLAPHLMHYAVLIILTGYLCSYLFSISETGYALRPGEAFRLPGNPTEVQFQRFEPEYLRGNRVEAFDGYVIRPNAQMTIIREGQNTPAVLNFNEPIYVAGYGIYLSDFQPRKPGGGMSRTFVNLTVRRDPSAIVYRIGMAVFVLGLGLYIIGRKFRR